MNVTTILIVIGLVFAVIEQFNARGRSLLAWGLIFVCAALLWGQLF